MNFDKTEIELLSNITFDIEKWCDVFGKQILILDSNNHKSNQEKYLTYCYSYCKSIALKHYENFPVSSIILPSDIRDYVYPIYAFARLGDDISDECNWLSNESKIQKLNIILDNLSSCKDILLPDVSNKTTTENTPTINNSIITFNPIIVALADVIIKFDLDINLFQRLYRAFIYDSDFKSFDTFDDIYNYCNKSANPIGEILLNLFGEVKGNNSLQNIEKINLSNNLCTALQLINFYQDLSIDKLNKRYYFPKILFENEEEISLFYNNSKLIKQDRLLEILTSFQKEIDILLKNSYILPKLVKNKRFGLELKLIFSAGNKLYKKSKLLNTDILKTRVKLKKFDYLTIIFNSIVY